MPIVWENIRGTFREFSKTLFPAALKIAVIVSCVTISIATIAAGIILQMPTFIYGLCVAVSIFCVVIAAYYWKSKNDKNTDSSSSSETSISTEAPLFEGEISKHDSLVEDKNINLPPIDEIPIPVEAPPPEEGTSEHDSSEEEMESIQLHQDQIPTASFADLISPSKFNLENYNNHCYLNAALQLLFAIVPFRNEIMENAESRFIQELKKIFQYLATGEKRYQLQIFDYDFSKSLDEIGKFSMKLSAGYQEDVVEFLLPLLDAIMDESYNKKLPFEGRFRTLIESIDSKDNFRDLNYDRFTVVPITLNSCHNLEQGLLDYTKKKLIPWETSNGTKIDATVENLLHGMPPFLLFHLHRFEFDGTEKVKLSNDFFLPESIDMAKFMVDNTTPCKYKLAGMVCHQGIANNGHYLTYICNKDGKSFVQLDSTSCNPPIVILEEEFMKHDDFIKNGYLALYVHI
ncbi:MAG: ubiquitin carboxyl-terminal hydrolase [Puniceicoccales bacterium]|jgi:uncharacterized UBP type Zn finger protein|nr:ubiquitin carboxyl-terminal hydrolase [Puniceicoccales bacterium]